MDFLCHTEETERDLRFGVQATLKIPSVDTMSICFLLGSYPHITDHVMVGVEISDLLAIGADRPRFVRKKHN